MGFAGFPPGMIAFYTELARNNDRGWWQANRDRYDFSYAYAADEWIPLLTGAEGKILSTRTAGGFVGVTFGLYAYAAK